MAIDTLHGSAHSAFGTLGALATLVVIGLAGCTRQSPTARHTVEEYRANPSLRREQFARCSNDPGTLGTTPDCVNVRQATLLEDTKSVRDLPPVVLPPAPNRPPESRQK